MTVKGNKYAIWWEPKRETDEGGWVTDETNRVALYASERSAKKDIRDFVHSEQYNARHNTPLVQCASSNSRQGLNNEHPNKDFYSKQT